MGEGIRKYGVSTARNTQKRQYVKPQTRVRVNEARKKAQELARQKQDVNAGLNPKQIATLAKLESKNATRKTEQLNVVDENGKVVFSKSGTKRRVSLYPWEAAQLKDKIVTHNHPTEALLGKGLAARIGVPINGVDLALAIRNNAKEIRASAQGYVYSIKRPKNGWGNIKAEDIERDFMTEWNKSNVWSKRYVMGGKTYDDKLNRQGRYNVGVQSGIMRKLAKKYGLNYTRRRMS